MFVGFSVIEAKISDKANGKLLLKQSRYLSSGRPSPNEDNIIWNVPIVMKIDGKIVRILLDSKEKEFSINEIQNSKYVHLNANSKGFYCTQYDNNMLFSLFANNNDLTDTDQLCLIRDLKALSKSGYMFDATQQVLNLFLASKDEKSYIIWDAILSAAADIDHLIAADEADHDLKEKYNAIMCDLLTPIYNSLNKWGDGDDEKQKGDIQRNDEFRPLIISSLAKYGQKQVINDILSKFDSFIMDKKEDDEKCNIGDALRSTVYSNALKYGDKERYHALKDYYMTTKDSMDKRRALSCLGSTNDEELILNTLEWVKDSDEVRKQDKIFALSSCARNRFGKQILWDFLQKTIDEWKVMFDGGGFILNSIVKLPAGFVNDKKADEIEKFYSGLTEGYGACQKSMKQCVETIRLNAKWRKEEIDNIKQWVNKNALQK